MDKGIWVSGTGQATGVRDECVRTVGSQVREPSAAATPAASSPSLEQLRGVLLGAGPAPSAVSRNPVHDDFPTAAGAMSLDAGEGAVVVTLTAGRSLR